jgi:hypothetical protein
MGKAYLNGWMVVLIQDPTQMIKNMVLVFLNGQMVDYMKGFGMMENNMEKER